MPRTARRPASWAIASIGVVHAIAWLAQLARRLRTAPPVPTTSIYSRSDGVVAWQACVSEPHPLSENIEVDSSHLGLIWHPDVRRIVTDRLAQPVAAWQPWATSAAATTT